MNIDFPYSKNAMLELQSKINSRSNGFYEKIKDTWLKSDTLLLDLAIQHNCIDLAIEITNKNNDIIKFDGFFFLRLACYYGRIEIVKHLVSIGSVIDFANGWALSNAIENGYRDIIVYLIENGASVKLGRVYGSIRKLKNKGVFLDVVEMIEKHQQNF